MYETTHSLPPEKQNHESDVLESSKTPVSSNRSLKSETLLGVQQPTLHWRLRAGSKRASHATGSVLDAVENNDSNARQLEIDDSDGGKDADVDDVENDEQLTLHEQYLSRAVFNSSLEWFPNVGWLGSYRHKWDMKLYDQHDHNKVLAYAEQFMGLTGHIPNQYMALSRWRVLKRRAGIPNWVIAFLAALDAVEAHPHGRR